MKTPLITMIALAFLASGLAPAAAKTGNGSSRSHAYAQNDSRYNLKKQYDGAKFWRDQTSFLR